MCHAMHRLPLPPPSPYIKELKGSKNKNDKGYDGGTCIKYNYLFNKYVWLLHLHSKEKLNTEFLF